MFRLFKEVQALVCVYLMVESVPLLACGLFHTAPIHDVTSFPEWVICPGSSQRNKSVGIKVPLILFPGGCWAFFQRSVAAVWGKSASNWFVLEINERSGSRPELPKTKPFSSHPISFICLNWIRLKQKKYWAVFRSDRMIYLFLHCIFLKRPEIRQAPLQAWNVAVKVCSFLTDGKQKLWSAWIQPVNSEVKF